jgi:uncharacterized membrane protein YoaK (UPF0700 family)
VASTRALGALQASRALRVTLVVLTALTGMIDAVSYLGLGHVFTANMTGNVVLLGFALVGAGQISVLAALLSLAAFLVGATAGGRLARLRESTGHRWVVTALSLETALVAAAAAATLPVPASRYVVVVLLALAMGVRNATVRRLGIPDLTTTVLTLTLTGLAADTQLPGAEPGATLARRLSAVGAMLLGAVLGALLLRGGLAVSLSAAAILLALVTAAYLARQERTPRTTS